jgi:DNA-binding transcriptional ArsR family regulator
LLQRLATGPASAGRLAHGFDVSRPAIAKHLKVLREAGLVQVVRTGRNQVYSLDPAGSRRVETIFRELNALWERAPVALETYRQVGDAPVRLNEAAIATRHSAEPGPVRFFEWVRSCAGERAASAVMIRRLSRWGSSNSGNRSAGQRRQRV